MEMLKMGKVAINEYTWNTARITIHKFVVNQY